MAMSFLKEVGKMRTVWAGGLLAVWLAGCVGLPDAKQMR